MVIKPAEQTPVGILLVAELIQDILPPGVLNIVNGFGAEVGRPCYDKPTYCKIAFTGSTQTWANGDAICDRKYYSVTLELGGKSPNLFFEDIMDKEDDFLEKRWKVLPCLP